MGPLWGSEALSSNRSHVVHVSGFATEDERLQRVRVAKLEAGVKVRQCHVAFCLAEADDRVVTATVHFDQDVAGCRRKEGRTKA